MIIRKNSWHYRFLNKYNKSFKSLVYDARFYERPLTLSVCKHNWMIISSGLSVALTGLLLFCLGVVFSVLLGRCLTELVAAIAFAVNFGPVASWDYYKDLWQVCIIMTAFIVIFAGFVFWQIFSEDIKDKLSEQVQEYSFTKSVYSTWKEKVCRQVEFEV